MSKTHRCARGATLRANMASKPAALPHLVAVDASGLPQSPEQVAALHPDRRVAVSHGCEERCAAPSRKEDVTLDAFVAQLRRDPRAGYLKQCPLEDLGCRWSLRAHAPFLREATAWAQETAFLWVGGADATTGLHSDDEDNVLLVTHGRKRVLLYPPHARRHLDPNPRYDNGTECCELDAFLSEAAKARAYPPYAGCAPPLSFVLSQGDALFIPRDWFHAVRSLDVSVSVNVFYSTAGDLATRGVHRTLTDFAHNRLGLWRANCVCHRPAGGFLYRP